MTETEDSANADRTDEQTEDAADEKPKKKSALREGAILVAIALVLYYVMLTFVARPYLIPSESMEPTLHGCPGCVGDRIMVDKLSYRFTDPAPGDVVVFKGPPSWSVGYKSIRSDNPALRAVQNALSYVGFVPPDQNDLVKRIIATGGQTVECRADTGLTVDGKPLDEPYLDVNTMMADPAIYPCLGNEFGPVEVPPDRLWVMGDNRTHSADSRAHCTSTPVDAQKGLICTGDPMNGTIPVDNVIGKAQFIAWPPSRWGGVTTVDPQQGVESQQGSCVPAAWPPRTVIRKSSGLRTLESALYRSGLGPVAGVDEVGRGACAGPLVVAACVLGPNKLTSLARLDDSKKLNEKERERLFPLIRRYALAYHVVFIPSTEVDRRGVHVANIEGMRRAVAGLTMRPGYVLSDGFRVPGLPMPSLPVISGDAAAACIAAASVLAKVSRDRLMVTMDREHPGYGFADHKGYSTAVHGEALVRLGPSAQHRHSFINVRRIAGTQVAELADVDAVLEQRSEFG